MTNIFIDDLPGKKCQIPFLIRRENSIKHDNHNVRAKTTTAQQIDFKRQNMTFMKKIYVRSIKEVNDFSLCSSRKSEKKNHVKVEITHVQADVESIILGLVDSIFLSLERHCCCYIFRGRSCHLLIKKTENGFMLGCTHITHLENHLANKSHLFHPHI